MPMLSMKHILSSSRLMEQTGGRDYQPSMEDGPALGGVLQSTSAETVNDETDGIRLSVGSVLHPSGDVTLADRETVLPEGAAWID